MMMLVVPYVLSTNGLVETEWRMMILDPDVMFVEVCADLLMFYTILYKEYEAQASVMCQTATLHLWLFLLLQQTNKVLQSWK